MNLDKISAITPSEYTKYRYIDKILYGLKGEIRSACDVGCGVGSLLLALEDHGIKSKGIDTSDESLAICRTRIRSDRIRIERMSVFDLKERFDLVYLTDVLEHMPDDAGLLRFIRNNILNKNGYLIITVPAHRLLYSPFDRNAGHMRRYDKARIISLMENGGFEPVLCWSYGALISHIVANLSLVSIPGRPKAKRAGMDYGERTRVSAIRQFGCIIRPFVSKVNVLHRVMYALDYSLRNLGLGIGYCLLCKLR